MGIGIGMNLSKLQKVDLRNVWKHEALDFVQWLSNLTRTYGL